MVYRMSPATRRPPRLSRFFESWGLRTFNLTSSGLGNPMHQPRTSLPTNTALGEASSVVVCRESGKFKGPAQL
jgi:hypothetical protein